MPWSRDHKAQTREKIIDAAAAAFRARGAGSVALSDVMKEAGLTHGGFYAHFKSKDDLIAAALKSVNEVRLARFDDAPARSGASKLDAAVDVYLTSRHREHPEDGCTIATLGSELARVNGKARAQIDANARAWLAAFADCAPGSTQACRSREATGAFAAMIGGLILARAVEDPHESDRILADVRAFLHAALGWDGGSGRCFNSSQKAR
jgi:TetR/AcrR family transcriptional regulator, transcriptional repressor for nem operon